MSVFYDFVKNFFSTNECVGNTKYSTVGHTFHFNTDDAEGIFWFYEGENFTIDIHDVFIKKEIIHTSFSGLDNFYFLYSSYLVTANGESFNPYQNLSSNSLYVINTKNSKDYRFILHKNSPYLGIGINFKQSMIDEYLSSCKNKVHNYEDLFFNTSTITNKPLGKIAKDILNCKMVSPAAEIFFESKAKEWLSITMDSFLNKYNDPIPLADDVALKNVVNYIDDHYATSIPQKTLEKISAMSGTKLKKLFKQKYQCTITEYTQRRRMNMAEILLLNSSLKIQDIAEAVGYSSHSKFSTCFKKYKGFYPKDIKKYAKKYSGSSQQ
ncbi:MAG: helix-turn-helix domain-containing protein [Eggerthia catenaformis]|uniref:helix-turn-helix domain-containing protein n=1 Tax=Eggerthia catenaformis TaxID=31973 RepID=UPI0004789A6A|nr:AraC family transcriptional regulator [Eggerthia catenaformis]OUC51415.1 AraC family transcriptional regulator [Eggerthia catenaformis]